MTEKKSDLLGITIVIIALVAWTVLISGCSLEKRHETIHTQDETTTTETIKFKRN